MKSVFLCQDISNVERVYGNATKNNICETLGSDGCVYTKEEVFASPELFRDTEYIFSTWSMPVLTGGEIDEYFPSLRAVFYAAGSVRFFARPFLERGMGVCSAWAANAVPVAEYTVAQIILACKGYFTTSRYMSSGNYAAAKEIFSSYSGNYGEKIGIIGAGMIGKLVIKMLKAYKLDVLVFDPFLSEESAKELGVRKCTLDELFERCRVISNHLANNEQTQGMLTGKQFSKMRPFSTFINTGRGAQVVEEDLSRHLKERPDVTAILDVTHPEPPQADHPFYKLDNCILTPHIAGSSGEEVKRMSELVLEQALRFDKGEETEFFVTLEMLKTMA